MRWEFLKTFPITTVQAMIYFTRKHSTQQLCIIYINHFSYQIRWLFMKLNYHTDISETGINNRTIGVDSWHSNFLTTVFVGMNFSISNRIWKINNFIHIKRLQYKL